MDLSEFREIATIVGVVVGATSLVFTAWNTSITRKTNRARFWLDLRKSFAEHDEVHRALRPGGKWTQPGTGPETVEEWSKVEAYMGLFETCEDLLTSRQIDLRSFRESYGYRVQNILANERVVQAKLFDLARYWTRFRHLVVRLDFELP